MSLLHDSSGEVSHLIRLEFKPHSQAVVLMLAEKLNSNLATALPKLPCSHQGKRNMFICFTLYIATLVLKEFKDIYDPKLRQSFLSHCNLEYYSLLLCTAEAFGQRFQLSYQHRSSTGLFNNFYSKTNNFQISAYICQYFSSLAFCFQDLQTKQNDFVKTAKSRLPHKKKWVIWLRKSFLKQIEKDRILFLFCLCSLCNMHQGGILHQKMCHWELATQMWRYLVCVTASTSIRSTDAFPNRPRTWGVLVEGQHNSTPACYTKRKLLNPLVLLQEMREQRKPTRNLF